MKCRPLGSNDDHGDSAARRRIEGIPLVRIYNLPPEQQNGHNDADNNCTNEGSSPPLPSNMEPSAKRKTTSPNNEQQKKPKQGETAGQITAPEAEMKEATEVERAIYQHFDKLEKSRKLVKHVEERVRSKVREKCVSGALDPEFTRAVEAYGRMSHIDKVLLAVIPEVDPETFLESSKTSPGGGGNQLDAAYKDFMLSKIQQKMGKTEKTNLFAYFIAATRDYTPQQGDQWLDELEEETGISLGDKSLDELQDEVKRQLEQLCDGKEGDDAELDDGWIKQLLEMRFEEFP